jgi:hypothetical protein
LAEFGKNVIDLDISIMIKNISSDTSIIKKYDKNLDNKYFDNKFNPTL